MRVFLSYHTPDREKAQALKAAIEQAMPDTTVFFDVSGLRYGHLWQPALSRHIQESDAFIILVSSRAGDWQKFEYYEARDRKAKDDSFILLPVIIADPRREAIANLPGLTQLHWVEATEPTAPEPLAKIVAALSSKDEAAPVEPWRLVDPYRGLEALDEQDTDFFFGREIETGQILQALEQAPGKLMALIGNSGVGKSSLAKAGVIGSLKSQRTPDGTALRGMLSQSRKWAFLTMTPGTNPFDALVSQFLGLWQENVTDPGYTSKLKQWSAHLRAEDGLAAFGIADLMRATDERLAGEPLLQTPPTHYFLYIDQGEELYTRTSEADRLRFSLLVAKALQDVGDRLSVMTSLRADYYGAFQANEHLFPLSLKIDVAPLSQAQLTRVLEQPAQTLRARFENPGIIRHIVQSTGRQMDVLPLLADLLRDLWQRMRERGDGILRISDHPEIIQVGAALKVRAEQFLSQNPGKVEAVKRLFTLRLSEVPRAGEPVRAEMVKDESTAVSRAEWALAEQLAGPDMRLVVTGTKDGLSKAWVAHEVLLRSWPTLAGWLESERDFLVWKGDADAKRRLHAQATPEHQLKSLLMGLDLDLALKWQASREGDLGSPLVAFIEASAREARRSARTRQRMQSAVGVLLLMVIAGLLAYIFEQPLQQQWFLLRYVHPVSSADALKLPKGDSFLDCGDITGEAGSARSRYSSQCPEMVVIPAGAFEMGSSNGDSDEAPIRRIAMPHPFAVSKFEVTAEQWAHCVRLGGCPTATGAGTGLEAVSSVSWEDARTYVKWLSRFTGKPYRLLSEAEWEYAARGGSSTAYHWGEKASHDFANYGTDDCCEGLKQGADQWERVSPVGSFPANAYGLYDVAGNLWEWVQDCYGSYVETRLSATAVEPADGATCKGRVLRGGSWNGPPEDLRSSDRGGGSPGGRGIGAGFRVARTLD